jgi:lipopolysaccharide transport system ATP-binding protein
MSKESIIQVEGVSKKFNLGRVNHRTFTADFSKALLNRESKHSNHAFYALKDISFSVQEGEVLGIVGRNGAGKSTLLKLLSRITSPSSGTLRIKGRMASLLEVGTGFHPELTGRENIFLNGAILGMRRKEIAQKFEEIIDFAGLGQFVDTPVKRYSSGMYVRLAFAVAAYLDPEILIIDEVLAVGDAEFQKKCIERMRYVSSTEGKTILFVSHNLAFVKALCSRALLLQNGTLVSEGLPDHIIQDYYTALSATGNAIRNGNGSMRLLEVKVLNIEGQIASALQMNSPFRIVLLYEVRESIRQASLSICINSKENQRIVSYWSEFNQQHVDLGPGTWKVEFMVDRLKLSPGDYYLVAYAAAKGVVLEEVVGAGNIVVAPVVVPGFAAPTVDQGLFVDSFEMRVEQLI